MTPLLYALLLITAVMAITYAYALTMGGIKRSNLRDWGFVLLISLIMGVLALVNTARADEWTYLEYTEAYIGLDWQLREDNPQCVPEGSGDRITSHGGLTQHLLGYGEADLELVYTHHSCAINDDLFVYDALGIRVTYRLNW